MAAANLITPKTAAENSADQVIAADAALSFGLKLAVDGVIPWDEPIRITRKDDNGKYTDTGLVLNAQNQSVVIDAEGTFRVEKPITRAAIGVVVG